MVEAVGEERRRVNIWPIPVSDEFAAYFWSLTQRDEETGCLLWMGDTDRRARGGYGTCQWRNKAYRAHRVAYCLHYGIETLPAETPILDHLCCVRPCVEWSHLEAVTVAVNTLRGRSPQLTRERRLRTSCPQGHPLQGDNLILQTQKGGIRQRCRLCYNAKQAAWLRKYRADHPEVFRAYRQRYNKAV